MVALSIQREQSKKVVDLKNQFPVTVDPKNKLITENEAVNDYLEGPGSPLSASVAFFIDPLWNILKSAAIMMAEAPWYRNIASVSSLNGHFVTITPGMRKEQVVNAFAKPLGWSDKEKKEFLGSTTKIGLLPAEGTFFPASYFVDDTMTPAFVKSIVDRRFAENVLQYYGTSTAKIVPIDQALIIASLIQRETIGNDDARLISGIIWNRIFINMKLQVDATLQYARANVKHSSTKTNEWWPPVVPKDKYIKSPYNTYLHKGLPPTPIANPSVGAIIAALNPIETPCLYYFNDKAGKFHCNVTYTEHVAELKMYY